MENLKITADNIGKYLSLVSVWIVVSGITFNYFYYYHFNILITEYIDLSESLLMFIPIAIKVFVSISLLLVIQLLFHMLNIILKIKIPDTPEKFARYIQRSVFILIFIILYYTVDYSVFGTLPFFSHQMFLIILFLCVGTFSLMASAFAVAVGMNLFQYFKLFIILSILFFLSFGLTGYYAKIDEVENMNKTVSYKCIFNDSTIMQTDSSHLFVGQTKGYVFIYDGKKKIVNIFERSKIKMLAFERFKTSSFGWPDGFLNSH
jgi:hypothetical protein